MNLRIVRVRRGELVTGFRVQRESYRTRRSDWCEKDGPYWANTGRKCYTLESATEYRDWLLKNMHREPETVEEITEETKPQEYADKWTRVWGYTN